MITYRKLAEIINTFTEDQKDLDVSVYNIDEDEFYSADCVGLSEEDDVLEKDHPYIVFPHEEYTITQVVM